MKPISIVLVLVALGFGFGMAVRRETSCKSYQFQVSDSGSAAKTGNGGHLFWSASLFTSNYDRALWEVHPTRRADSLFELGQSVPLDAYGQVLALLARRPETESASLAHFLLERWAELDPNAALAWVLDLRDPSAREKALRTIFEDWVDADLATAFARACRIQPGYARNQAIGIVVDTISNRDPCQALALLQSSADPSTSRRFEISVLRRWADDDPKGAAIAAESLGRLPSAIYSDIAAKWASKDPSGALNWARSLLSGQARNQAFRAAVQAWGKVDIGSAAAFVAAEPPSEIQRQLVTTLAMEWVKDNPAGAVNWATNLPAGTARNRALESIAAGLANTDSQAALNSAKLIEPGPGRRRAFSEIGAQLALEDPENASVWAGQLSVSDQRALGKSLIRASDEQDLASTGDLILSLDPAARNQLLSKLTGKWAQENLTAAVDWVNALPVGETRCAALDGVISSWCQGAPKEVAEYVLQTPPSRDDKANTPYLATIGSIWAKDEPLDAANWAASLPGGDMRVQMLKSVVTSWACNSPSEAAEYALQIPAADDRQSTVLAALEIWAVRDRQAATAWTASLPGGTIRDAAIEGVSRDWAQIDPGGAADWLVNVTGGDRAGGALQDIVGRWLGYNPEAARTWIRDARISDEAKANLLRVPETK